MASTDLCLVCADTLDFTGFGPCGHKECCSRCVARLRFVMEDSKCVLCKQESPQIYFTRYMGDYTDSLRPEQFAELPARAQGGELFELPEVSGYFDDRDHYRTIKSLCSYTHPMMSGATFGSLAGLKRKLADVHKLHFCDLCVKGRKVFISEQVLYSKPDLEKHARTGDDAGPLAESGFRGHPNCRFCRRRFYDGDELYRHMESQHEHCFICRKLAPHKFVYYKDYAELEEHFQAAHHPCPHPTCLERKFVVFAEEPELKRHFASEHGSEMNMSRAQRRQALSINIQLSYNREAEAAAAAAAAHSRPGVVIGGGGSLAGGRGGMRHSRSDGAMAAAMQASLESSQVEAVMRQSAQQQQAAPASVTFSAEDFPTVSGLGGSGTAPLGTWVGASGPGQGPTTLTQEDFPALPTMSRNQRRRARNTASTLAGRLAASNAPIRVVNRAQQGAAASSSAAAAGASSSSSGLVRHSSSTGSLPAAAAAAAAAASQELAGGVAALGVCDDADSDAPACEPDGMANASDAFPALPGGAGGSAAQAHPAWVPVRRGKKGGPSAPAPAAPAVPSAADFPTLASALPARLGSSGRSSGSRPGSSGSSRPGTAGAAAPAAAPQSVPAAVAAAGGVSEELKAANRALIERCKAALSDQAFLDFKQDSAAFMQGRMSAADYHDHVVGLGLLQLVPQLAALCPDADKRVALVEANRAYLTVSADKLAAPGPGSRGWVPPEAAMAALQEVEAKGSWTCERCTLVNAPGSRACEVCAAPRPRGPPAGVGASAKAKLPSPRPAAPAASSNSSAASQDWAAAAAAGAGSSSGGGSSSSGAVARAAAAAAAPSSPSPPPPPTADSWPSLAGPGRRSGAAPAAPEPPPAAGSSSAAASSSSSTKKGGKKGGTKTSLQELLAQGKTAPGNAWSQPARRDALVAPPTGQTASLGQWGKSGGAKLAKKHNALNDAWGSK